MEAGTEQGQVRAHGPPRMAQTRDGIDPDPGTGTVGPWTA